MSDYYHDDPIEEAPAGRFPSKLIASAVVVIASVFFFQSTLASNISINSGKTIEFGQSVSVTAACSGANNLMVTPKSSFVNEANGTGAYYLSSVSVSGIPSSCNGVDFNISFYDSVTSTALPIFASTKTVASVWNNGGSFQGGRGWLGSTVSSGSGSFTVTFTTPVALAAKVEKVTLQSIVHAAGDCATENICAVGDTGPGGGTVFYVSSRFTMTGTTCNTNCNYLELAPATWFSNPEPAVGLLVAVTSLPPSPTSTEFGTGWTNTNYLKTYAAQNGGGGGRKSGIYAAVRYGTAGAPVGEWFLPSKDELQVLWLSPINTQLRADWYWSSSYSGNQGWETFFPNPGPTYESYTLPYNGGYVDNGHSVRPIRAF